MAKHDKQGLVNLRAQLKSGELKNLYIIFGDEDFLKEYYIEAIKKMIVEEGMEEFNYTVFEGEKQDFEEISMAFSTPPMMADKKLVVIKDSGIFKITTDEPKSNFEAKKAFWGDILKESYEDVCLVFHERTVDKRSALYKAAAKAGESVECAYQEGVELLNWVIRGCRSAGKIIGEKEAEYLVSNCDSGMNSIKRELEKLFSFCDTDKITIADIDKIVTKLPQNRVFEMINDMLNKNGQQMFEKLEEMKSIKRGKEKGSAFGVLSLLCSNFEKILRVKLLLEKGLPYKTVASELKIFYSQMNVYSSAAKAFSKPFLREAICRIAQIDLDIKNGKVKDWLAVEQFLAWCINN